MKLSRRAYLRAVGGTLAVGVGTGIAYWAYRSRSKGPSPIIDTHIHVARPNLPGVPEIPGPHSEPFGSDASLTAAAVGREMKAAGVSHALCMPTWEITADDPLGIASTLKVASFLPQIHLHPVGFADPTRTDAAHLARVGAALAAGKVKALKAYLGYLPHAADSPGYRPYYKLAGEHNIPVIFHTVLSATLCIPVTLTASLPTRQEAG